MSYYTSTKRIDEFHWQNMTIQDYVLHSYRGSVAAGTES
ncbi:hypothetical protein SAMN05421730_101231 [Anaerobium acetethylicum]|uniref:Uncharacterized protein n=1 Tax=Anaerobium acetethylicum TaxID=1619234 RepID=A0A1D3TUB6_9FIRM|nr:hypothetical protein SAMN05421730_101231 [Anaerobium acetethylicum]